VNVEDAFIGKLDLTQEPDCGIGCILTESPVEDGPGKGALPFAHFLAVRLLPIDGVRYKEERYVPPHGISANGTDTEDYLGMLVHYAYRESKRHFLFGDLQGLPQYFIVVLSFLSLSPRRSRTRRPSYAL